MRFKGSIIAFIVLLVLLSIAYLLNIRKHKITDIETKAKRIFHIKADDINKIEIITDNNSIEFIKEGTQWKYKNPDIAIDKKPVESLINTLLTLNYKEKLQNITVKDKENFGVYPPKKKIVLISQDKEYWISIGTQNPVNNLVYIMTDEGKVYLVDNYIERQIYTDLKKYRERDIIDVKVAQIKDIIIRHGINNIHLIRQGNKWTIDGHKDWEIGNDEVEGFVRDMDTLIVKDFLSDKKEDAIKYGFNNPQAIVIFTYNDGTKKKLLMQIYNEKVLAKLESKSTIYELDNIDKVKFLRDSKFFRKKEILPFQSWDITAMKFIYKDNSFTLTKSKSGKWVLDKQVPKGKVLDETKVDDILTALEKLKAKDFVAYNPYMGFDQPLLQMEITGDIYNDNFKEKKSKTVRIIFGNAGDFGIYVKEKDKNTVYVVKDNLLNDLPKDIESILKEKKVKNKK